MPCTATRLESEEQEAPHRLPRLALPPPPSEQHQRLRHERQQQHQLLPPELARAHLESNDPSHQLQLLLLVHQRHAVVVPSRRHLLEVVLRHEEELRHEEDRLHEVVLPVVVAYKGPAYDSLD